MSTVTNGLASAPFLAIRSLHQLAADEKERLPKGAAALLQETYTVDIVTAATDVQDLGKIRPINP